VPSSQSWALLPKTPRIGAVYAKAQSAEFYQKQQEMMFKYVAAADVVIPTALVPVSALPSFITEEMVRGMQPGSVILDLAASRGETAL